MRKFATADCETDPFKFNRIPKPFLWGFYDKEGGFRSFSRTEEFVEFIKNYEGLIYLHNGGKFDVHFLMPWIEPQEEVMIINGRIAKLKLGKCELRDSYMLLPVPLSAYKKDEISYDIFEDGERQKIENNFKITSYLKGDCIYLYEILEKQFEEYGQKLTLASSAFDYWHKKYNPYKYKPRTNSGFFNHFKEFYYGGRVQCFEKGIIETNFNVFDINSAYPYAMLSDHPYGNEYAVKNKLDDNFEGKDFIQFWGKSKGALPFRDNGLKFPDDNKSRLYKVTGWELKTGLENNLIKIEKIDRVYKFFESINFKEYVDNFYKQKNDYKDKDAAKYLLAKLYLNSLYGKFGQSSLDHRDFEITEQKYILSYMDAGYEHEADLENGLVLMSKIIDEKKMKFYSVVTAASVTGFVRAYLYNTILKCDRPLYCDTDSIAAVKFSGNIGKELGQWENEGEFCRAAIGGKKLYCFERVNPKKGEKYKISSKGAKLTQKDIFSIARGEEIEYKNISPTFSVGKTPSFITRKIRKT